MEQFAIYIKKSKRSKYVLGWIGLDKERCMTVASEIHDSMRASNQSRTLAIRRPKDSFPRLLPWNYIAENHEFVTSIAG